MAARLIVAPDWQGQVTLASNKFIAFRLNPAIARDMRRYCPVRTGALVRTIKVRGRRIRIGDATVDYALAVEYGTRPHQITPVRKKALFWPGALHPVKTVHHPGTRAQPFIRPAVYQYRTRL